MTTEFNRLKSLIKQDRITPQNTHRLKQELFYLECNKDVLTYVLEAYNSLTKEGKQTANLNNSIIYYLIGLTDTEPKALITQTPTTLPDIDYDSDARNEIKEYLVSKYGKDHVSLLGTYMTLKVKGALKDILRQIRPDLTPEQIEDLKAAGEEIPKTMAYEEVNKLTKKFDIIKRTDTDVIEKTLKNCESAKEYEPIQDYSSEMAFFYATLEVDPELKKWFKANPDVEEALLQILGNAKGAGTHPGGIVVSSANIKNIVPLFKMKDEPFWITQPEMTYVEWTGLIKYDFLGLKTLEILNMCLKLVNKRHNTDLTLPKVPLSDQDVLREFKKGNTISIFQFNTDLVQPNLLKFRSIDSIIDLAIITSIFRPGPLDMGMDEVFIRRKNGEEKITFSHPSLEPILKSTYGLVVFQESVLQICTEIGGISKSDSVTILKAMGKKQFDKLVKYKDKFIAGAMKRHNMPDAIARELWGLLESFAQYGFNKSHAIAYGITSYISMWFKTRYPLEWIASVLTKADKDDFKVMYTKWSEQIEKPNVNTSGSVYFINDDNKKVVMPFSAVNGVGDKAVEAILECRQQGPFTGLKDFFHRVDKRKANKAVFMNLVLSGCFDSFRPPEISENRFRKSLFKELFELRHLHKKPGTAEKAQDEALIRQIDSMTRGQILMKQISLLNFASFDYFTEFKDLILNECKKKFYGKTPIKPHEALDLPNNTEVIIAGGIESIAFVPIKSGKLQGQERALIKFANQGPSVDVTIWPRDLIKDDQAGGNLRNLQEYTPMIIKGRINEYQGRKSINYGEGVILL